MKTKFFSILVLILGLTLSFAIAQRSGNVAPDVAKLKQHIGYLASDKLDGRKTGTPGATAAANYIAEQFKSYGLTCATPTFTCSEGKNTGFTKEYPFISGVELGKYNSLRMTVGTTTAIGIVGEEWMPLGFSSNGAISRSKIAFVGYGITAPDLQHDDYAKVDAKGNVVIAFAGSPDGDNPHGQFTRFAESRFKAVAAKDHGAKALVIIATDEKFKNDKLAKLSYDQTAGEAGLPVIVLSRQSAARLLGLGDPGQLAALEKSGSSSPEAAQKIETASLSLSVELTRHSVPSQNVVGVLQGTDPKLKNEYIVIGAHYDHLGHGGEFSRAPGSSEIHHGADDNASGVAAVLELARILSAEKKLRRSVIFVSFSGEESGLIGSNYYVKNPPEPLSDTVAMINLDMVGRLKDQKLTIGGVGTATEFRKMIETANAPAGAPQRFALQLNDDGYGPSDHSSFYSKQIPVLFFFTGTHDDYHMPSDTADKINYDGEARVVTFVAELARSIDAWDQRPTYALTQSAPQTRTGFKISLGTIPSYAESTDGLALDGVREGSPAATAGLKAGDKIVKLAGKDIKNVYDYTYVLGEMKAGQEYEVEVMRGTERLKLKIVPAARP